MDDSTYSLILAIVSLVIMMIGIMILMGRGDWALSGYNTASEEKRKRYNLMRLRMLSGIGMIIMIVSLDIFFVLDLSRVGSYVVFAEAVIVAILSETWAKRGY